MNPILSPLRYLILVDEKGRRLVRRDAWTVVIIALIITAPFVVFDGTNYFGEKGFLDRVGSFSSILTGFYVAALVTVATFSSDDVDKKITVGKVSLTAGGTSLSRREYVCAMFGYLAFSSLFISVLSILMVAVYSSIASYFIKKMQEHQVDPYWSSTISSSMIKISVSLIISHMIISSFHGLYYLIDRLYYKDPKILPKRGAGGR